MKQKIRVEVFNKSSYNFYGDLSEFIAKMQDQLILYPEAQIAFNNYDDCGDSRCDIEIFIERLETDEEEAKREEQEKQWADAREKNERAYYERLKAKFG